MAEWTRRTRRRSITNLRIGETGCIKRGKKISWWSEKYPFPLSAPALVFGCVGSATEVSGFFRWLGVKWAEGQTQTDTQNTPPPGRLPRKTNQRPGGVSLSSDGFRPRSTAATEGGV